MSREAPKPDVDDIVPKPPLCFVVGPIGQPGSEIYDNAVWLLKGLITPVASAAPFGFTVKRADQDPTPGSITDSLILDILDADLVIADLTGANANAFYEVGLRHMAEKPIIHITSDGERLPFDNADQRTIFVNRSNYDNFEAAKSQLADAITAVLQGGYVVRNPVTRARAIGKLSESADSKDRLLLDVENRLAQLEAHVRAAYVPPPPAPSAPFALASEIGVRADKLQGAAASVSPIRDYVTLSEREKLQASQLSQNPALSDDDRAILLTAGASQLLSPSTNTHVRRLLNMFGRS